MSGAFAYKRSLVFMFPRGIYCWVTKPGAIWDCPDVDVDSTTCQVSEIAVCSHLSWLFFSFSFGGAGWRGGFHHSPPECIVQSHRIASLDHVKI